MKKIVLIFLVLSGVLCAGLIAAQEQRGPRIEIREMQYDFGKVAQGTQASHVFQVRNAGNEPLIIERIVPS
jgi:hypothetical protein